MSQLVRQAVRQIGRQAGRNTQLGFFFSRGIHLQTVGNPKHTKSIGDQVVKHSLFEPQCRRFESRPVIAGADPSTHYSFSPDLGSNPPEHQLLIPPPTPLKM